MLFNDDMPNKVSIETASRGLERALRQARGMGVSHSKAFTILSRVYSESDPSGIGKSVRAKESEPTAAFSALTNGEGS